MKLKPAIRFYLSDFKRPMAIFYGVVVAVFFLQMILNRVLQTSGTSSGSMEMASSIFLFVAGLNAFKTQFRMFLQHGLSRKTLFSSFIAAIFGLAVAMTAIDLIFAGIRSLFMAYETTYVGRFGSLYGPGDGVKALAEGFLWSVLSYMKMGMIGFFVTTLYYRLGKAAKLIVSIGVPALLFIVVPLVDSLYTKGAITTFLFDIAAFAYGVGISATASGGFMGLLFYLAGTEGAVPLYPYRAMLFSVICICVAGGLSFLLVRRATVKD